MIAIHVALRKVYTNSHTHQTVIVLLRVLQDTMETVFLESVEAVLRYVVAALQQLVWLVTEAAIFMRLLTSVTTHVQ